MSQNETPSVLSISSLPNIDLPLKIKSASLSGEEISAQPLPLVSCMTLGKVFSLCALVPPSGLLQVENVCSLRGWLYGSDYMRLQHTRGTFFWSDSSI